MTRALESGVTAEIAKQVVSPAYLVEMSFTTPERLWTGYGDLSWDSKTWSGVGHLLSISSIKETIKIQAEPVTVSIDGIDSANISLALYDDYQGRACNIYLAFLLSDAIVADPVLVYAGYMDVMAIVPEAGDTARVNIMCESRIADLLKPREWRYTHEDQQIDYPGDDGLEFVNDLQDKELVWAPF